MSGAYEKAVFSADALRAAFAAVGIEANVDVKVSSNGTWLELLMSPESAKVIAESLNPAWGSIR
jgi:cell division protein FtsN